MTTPLSIDVASPAAILRGWLRETRTTQVTLAARTGLSCKHVCELVTGKARWSVPVAVVIERATGLNAELLLVMQIRAAVTQARTNLITTTLPAPPDDLVDSPVDSPVDGVDEPAPLVEGEGWPW